MAKDNEKITLGVGDLYLNNVDVGQLKGQVEFTYQREKVKFKPANELSPVKTFIIGESAQLKASLAEIKVENIKLALGVTTTINESTSFPTYDPSSYVTVAGTSWDSLTFGGSKTIDEMSLRFEHERPDGTMIIIILYNASSMSEFSLPFSEEEIIMHDLTFEALAVSSRAAGDRLGVIVEQVQSHE